MNVAGQITGTRLHFQQDARVPQLVSAQAARTPGALAIAAGPHGMTYEELDARSNQLAHYLRSLGAGPGQLVALCLERSVSLVVAALGILKAGAAYLPLDPSFPADRLNGMLSDSKAGILISREALSSPLQQESVKVISLDRDAPRLASLPTANIPCEAGAKDLAYVIYTSGSTGAPKGVEITHANLLNLVLWHQSAFGVVSSDRATQLSSPAFDAEVWELWPYLTAGTSLHLPDDATRCSPDALRDWLVAEKITICFVPTPLAERMMFLRWPPETSLRILLTGGDVLHRCPPPTLPFSLINNYGPTECTVVATSGPVPPEENSSHMPPIGRPIANTEIYLLDEGGHPVDPGVAGEIYIGGAGVGRGYRHRPGFTAQKFIRNPFSFEPGARLYKTGDLARWLPDGQIEFLGRADFQVKIRGFRIELGEIESALEWHPDVEAAVVVTREEGGEKRLLAYLLPRSSSRLRPADLIGHLESRLPRYMIPSTFIQLETLPLTPNGKVDREALPAPDETNVLRERNPVAPRTSIEKRLAAIIACTLHLNHVGSNEDFFLLGGHSLLGMEMLSRIREEFSVELSLKDVFDHPTVTEISAIIDHLLSNQEPSEPEASVPALHGGNGARRKSR